MPIAVAMPKLGMTMEEGTVIEWPLAPGTTVERGDVVLVIESEKAEIDIESTGSGVFTHIYVEPDEVVPCGTLLAVIADPGDSSFEPAAFLAAWQLENAPAKKTPKPKRAAPARSAAPSTKPQSGKVPATPAARKLAKEMQIELEQVLGTGPGGRITREDIEDIAFRRKNLVRIAEGVSLDVPREGEGDPVILLPGFGTDVSAFSALIPDLRDHYRLVGVNLRGVGQSDPAPDEGYDVANMAADVAALIDAPAHIIGTSMGTAVAIELALAAPECVRSLTLLAPLVTVRPHLAAVMDSWCRIAELADASLLAESLLPWFFGSKTLADPKRSGQILRGLSGTLSQVSAQSLSRFRDGISAWSGTRENDLGMIAVPTLVIAAGDDLLTPDGDAIAGAIPGARFVVIRGAGHALGLEAADVVNREILAHLSS